MNIQHSSRSDSWATPLDVIVRARKVLGDVGLDPASDEWANARVGAAHYITREQDGLASPWPPGCSVFLNPPGGRLGNKSVTGLFWRKLMAYKDEGNLSHAIFLAFSAEALQSTQNKGTKALGEFRACIPSKRLRFESPLGIGKAPSHSNVIAYIPGRVDKSNEFVLAFRDLGTIINQP